MNAFTCEKASSMGFRSGEYGGRYSMRTPDVSCVSIYYEHGLNKLTKAVGELENLIAMVNTCVVHNQDTQWTRVSTAKRHLLLLSLELQRMNEVNDAHTTSCSRKLRYKSLVIEPSTTLETTMPSIVSNPVALSRWPRTKRCFIMALRPFLARPLDLAAVFSFLDVSSKKPSSSGSYIAIWFIKAFLRSSSRSEAIFLSFFKETPARTRVRKTVT